MAFVSFSDSLGFGASVDASTGTLINPSLITADGDPSVRTSGNSFTVTGSFNQSSVKFTMTGAAVASNTLRIDSLTYVNAKGDPTIIVGQMNLFVFTGLDLTRSALSRLFSGNDAIYGNRYADYVEGGAGNDKIIGRDGADTLLGGNGNDFLNGDTGTDSVAGGAGADTILGGAGADMLTGGIGRDSFRFTDKLASGLDNAADTIIDFVRGTDRIDLALMDAFSASKANDAFIFRGTGPCRSTVAGEIRYQKIDAEGTANDVTLIYIDTDADSAPEAMIRLQGLYDLRATDFIL